MKCWQILQILDENGCPATSSLQILEPVEGKAVEEMGGSWRRFHVGNERCRLPVVPDTQTAFTGFNRPPFSFFSVYTALNCSSLQRFHLSLFAALLPASSQQVHIVNYDFCPFSTIPAALPGLSLLDLCSADNSSVVLLGSTVGHQLLRLN